MSQKDVDESHIQWMIDQAVDAARQDVSDATATAMQELESRLEEIERDARIRLDDNDDKIERLDERVEELEAAVKLLAAHCWLRRTVGVADVTLDMGVLDIKKGFPLKANLPSGFRPIDAS